MTKLMMALRDLPDPDDKLKGLRCPVMPRADNVLLFVRRSAVALRKHKDSDNLHHRWVLIVPLIGTATLRVDRRLKMLQPGNLRLVPPLHLHGYADPDEKLCWLFITFDWPGMAQNADRLALHVKRDRESTRQLEMLTTAYRRMPQDAFVVTGSLNSLLADRFWQTAAKPNNSASLLERIQLAMLPNHPANLPDLAQDLGYSQSHLRARFREETGRSIGRYLRELRLRQAALAIQAEGLSVKQAAQRAGYPDIYSFSRSFSNLLGFPPSHLKRDGVSW